jgi:hypothetical protein
MPFWVDNIIYMWIITNLWDSTICVLYQKNNLWFCSFDVWILFSKSIVFVQKVTLKWDFVILKIVS